MEQTQNKTYNTIREWTVYIWSKWKLILLIAVVGGLIGLGIALLRKIIYKSELTFVLSNEDQNALSSLTSQFGIDLGGNNDVFSADNIVNLFTSRKMVQWALFQKVPNTSQTLLNIYVKEEELDKKWSKEERYKHILPFPDDMNKLSPLQDSMLREIHRDITSNYLIIERPNTKLSFFTVRTIYSNEIFSCYFTKYIVDATSKLYIDTKTSLAKQNLQMLQKEADSLHALINSAISATGSATDEVFNLNPSLQAARSPIYKNQFRAQVNEAAYGEVLKNLELAKITLKKQSPIYLILDEPHLPLERIGQGKLMSLIAGLFIGGILAVAFFVVKKIAQTIFANPIKGMPASINYISIKQFIARAKDWANYLAKRRVRIIIVAVIGGILGLLIALFSKPTYTGNLTFVLSSESTPSGGLMALASQFGLSFGSKNNAFDGENIIQLFESKKMFKRALFQTIPQNHQLLINEICNNENLFENWQKEPRLKPLVPFVASDSAALGVKDSLITEVYKYALQHYLTLDKVEKELNYYKITVVSTNEKVAHFLPLALTNVTATFYTEIKSDLAKRNLQMLEHEADSLQAVLNSSLQTGLVQREQILNLNPAFQSAEAPAKKSEVQTRVLEAAYQTVLQNLEIARVTLRKVTPVYQVIDEPGLALPQYKLGIVSSAITGAFLTTFFLVFFLLVKKTAEES